MKLEIQWGKPAVSWRRILSRTNNYPIAICKAPPIPFTGLNNVSFIMAELQLAMQDITWQQELSKVCGVYLVTDEITGDQYVGSASGICGVWQRWCDYVRTGHGDNQELEQRWYANPNCITNFRFTLLEPLPLGISRPNAEARENYWKIALGSRRFGMNRNGAMGALLHKQSVG